MKNNATWLLLGLLLAVLGYVVVFVQPWGPGQRGVHPQPEQSTPLPLLALEKTPSTLVRVDAAENPIAPDRVAGVSAESTRSVFLLSDAGIPIQAVWLRVSGKWHVEKLETPGQISLESILGADLIAPVGHVPERPNDTSAPLRFSPWSLVVIRGIPEDWTSESLVSIPIWPEHGDFWQVSASGKSSDDTWSCVVQPQDFLLEEPQAQLDQSTFPFVIRGPEELVLDVEISLAQGSSLFLDYQTIQNHLETIDVPISFAHHEPNSAWELIVNEDNYQQSVLPDQTLVNQSAGNIRRRILRSRILHFDQGDKAVVPQVKVGSVLSLLAKSSNDTWFFYQPRLVVEKRTEITIEMEAGLQLRIAGLSEFGDNLATLGLEWRFSEKRDGKPNRESILARKKISRNHFNEKLWCVPTMEQMRTVGQTKGIQSLWIDLKITDGGVLASSHFLPVPPTRILDIEIANVKNRSLTLKIDQSPLSLAGSKWISFAKDHNSPDDHDDCKINLDIAFIEEGDTPDEAIVTFVGDQGDDLPNSLQHGLPHLFCLDWPERSEFYEERFSGAFHKIPTRVVEIDFMGAKNGGPWTISWAFGCEKNLSFPLNFQLTPSGLPKRVALTVPERYAYLFVNERQVLDLKEAGPISYFLE